MVKRHISAFGLPLFARPSGTARPEGRLSQGSAALHPGLFSLLPPGATRDATTVDEGLPGTVIATRRAACEYIFPEHTA